MPARKARRLPQMGTIRGNLLNVSGVKALSLGLPLPPLAQDSDKSWVQVIPGEGAFEGHADGPFSFTADVVDRIVANADKRTTPIKFDYEHDTHNERLSGPKPASGHVLDLERRDGANGAELWAFVEWTKRAAQMIRDNEYNFNSPVIAFEWPDAESGEDQGPTLLSVGLTDVPFLDGQQAIQLRWKGKRMSAREQLRLSAVEALDKAKATLARDASQQDVIDAVFEQIDKQAQRDVVREVVAEVVGAGMDKPEEQAPEMTIDEEEPAQMAIPEDEAQEDEEAPEVDGNALLDALAEKSGLDRAAALAIAMEKLDALAAAINAEADRDGVVSESTQLTQDRIRVENSTLKAQINKLTQTVDRLQKSERDRARVEEAARARAIEDEVDGLIEEGNLFDSDRDSAIRLFTQDPESARKLFQHKKVPVKESQAGPDENTGKGAVDMDALDVGTRNLAQTLIAARRFGGDKQKCIARAIELRSN